MDEDNRIGEKSRTHTGPWGKGENMAVGTDIIPGAKLLLIDPGEKSPLSLGIALAAALKPRKPDWALLRGSASIGIGSKMFSAT